MSDTFATASDINDLASRPPAPAFDLDAYQWVKNTRGDDPATEAGRASAASRLPEAMVALVLAYFRHESAPGAEGWDRIYDATSAVIRSRLLADVKGSA